MAALKESITEDDLVQYFSAFGKVVRAVKSTDKTTGAKKTFGFVDFADFGIVKKVVMCSKHYIQGKRIRFVKTKNGLSLNSVLLVLRANAPSSSLSHYISILVLLSPQL